MRRGITPVVAIALLLGMTVVASGGAYTWITATTGEAQDDAAEQLSTELAVKELTCSGKYLSLTLKNSGDRDIQGKDAQIFLRQDGGLVEDIETDLSGNTFTTAGGLGDIRETFTTFMAVRTAYQIEIDFPRSDYRLETTCTAEPARTCDDIHRMGFTADGTYTIDPDGRGGVSPFDVTCDMTTDGGWIRMDVGTWNADAINNSVDYRMFRAHDGQWGGWNKGCGTEESFFASLPDGEAQANMEFQGGQTDYEASDILYENPATGANFTAAQVSAIRSVVTELSDATRMVATTADADGGDYAGPDGYGHETWVIAEGDAVDTANGFELTSGTDTDSGDTIAYEWSTDPGETSVTTCDTPAPALDNGGELPSDLVLPAAVILGVHTGGGSSWGYEQGYALVK